MGSWPWLIYLIDVLSTDGNYMGWVVVLLLSIVGYVALYAFQKAYEESLENKLFEGQTYTLIKPWRGLSVGEVILIESTFNHKKAVHVCNQNGTIKAFYNVALDEINSVITRDEKLKEQPKDLVKSPRRIAKVFMILSFLGILYANFMPQKETSYKMLAAYVGQNIVESPRTQQLADSTIKYLDSQIKKYTDDIEKAKQSEKEDKK